jgi:hypothetical protein
MRILSMNRPLVEVALTQADTEFAWLVHDKALIDVSERFALDPLVQRDRTRSKTKHATRHPRQQAAKAPEA